MFGWDEDQVVWLGALESDPGWYNGGIDTDDSGEDAHMAKLEQVEGLEPIASRDTNPWGQVDLYAPNAEPSEWGTLPWTLVTEKSDDGPLYAEVPGDMAYAYYERPWMIPEDCIR